MENTMDDFMPNMSEEIVTTTSGRKRKAGGGRRTSKGGGPTPYTTIPLPPCKVCGGVATGYHFGVITCEACKVCAHQINDILRYYNDVNVAAAVVVCRCRRFLS